MPVPAAKISAIPRVLLRPDDTVATLAGESSVLVPFLSPDTRVPPPLPWSKQAGRPLKRSCHTMNLVALIASTFEPAA